MTVWTRGDLDSGKAKKLDQAGRVCPDCRAVDSWTHKGCSGCASNETPDYLCRPCGAALVEEHGEYRAVARNGNAITEPLPADRCPSCKVIYLSDWTVDELDEFVETLPADLMILPELGIRTTSQLEVFVSVFDHPTVEAKSQTMSMRVAIQAQSEMFAHCLNHITRWDTADYGHEQSPTLVVEPPPPYTDDQRRELHVLLSRLTREAKAPLHFWTSSFLPHDGEEETTFQALCQGLETWRLDADRSALSLANKLIVGSAQGPFINAFRLLELVLKKQAEDELERARSNPDVSRESFLEKIRSLNFDLASRLRLRVQSLSKQPTDTLQELWKLLVPQKGYSADEVYSQIAKLRNQNAHEPRPEEALRLPWEEIPFDDLTELVAQLITDIVSVYEEDVSAS